MDAQPVSSSSASAGAGQPCSVCQMIENEPLHQVSITTDIIKDVVEPRGDSNKEKQERKKEAILEFLKIINALLNQGYGLLSIHTSNPHLLGLFDQAVNRSMLGMIPDDTFFDDNFERNFYRDKNHVVFRVLQKERPISTLSFHTKTSTDTGLVDPNHGQMRYFLKREMDDSSASEANAEEPAKELDSECEPKTKYRFIQDEEVDVDIVKKTGVTKTVFQESMTIQAKQIAQWSGTPEALVRYCFDKLFVHKYISAFSKLKKGGSVFLGVKERKTETKKWTEDSSSDPFNSDIRQLLGTHNLAKKLYRDVDGGLHICSEAQVPTVKDHGTGVFECQGVNIGGTAEQERFKNEFLQQADTRLCWYPSPRADQNSAKVEVSFHDVLPSSQPSGGQTSTQPSGLHANTQSSGGVVVVEIYIPKYQGVCFIEQSGPEAYEYQNKTDTSPGDLVRLNKENWIAKNRRAT